MLLAAGLTWLLVVLAGTILLTAYAGSRGKEGAPPNFWPASSQLRFDQRQPTLVMFVHPRCPCSRASLGELARLMATYHERLTCHVLFLQPAGMFDDWVETDSWKTAAAIPGVLIHRDRLGTEAKYFAAQTSGDTALYNQRGGLIFHGGITISRGHSGDSAGRNAIMALLDEQASGPASTAVFGCPLFGVEAQNQKGTQKCKP